MNLLGNPTNDATASDPRVTVIMPVKDPHLGFLSEALESIRTQTSPCWRLLIIIEPHEIDALAPALEAWTTDARTRIVAHESNGLAGAINTGMRHATTDFVAILLGDDLWEPKAIAVLEDYISRYSNADFFHSARRWIDDVGRSVSSILPARPSFTLADFAISGPVKHLLCWRREMGLAVGGLDERYSVGPDDYDFPWTMAEHGAVFCPIEQCLYVGRDHRSWPRLTTHQPRSEHVRQLRSIMRKHGVSRRVVRARVRSARRSYLQQCLYRSRWDERLHRWLGRQPRIWRDPYR